MNIFYLSQDPDTAASEHYNKHVVKMVLEAAQLLCTAHHVSGDGNVPYKPTHKNHPSAVWVRESIDNYNWCYQYMLSLGREYTKRYGKKHLTISKCEDVLYNVPNNITNYGFSEPPQCMPDEFKVDGDSVAAYWNYYEIGKAHLKDK